MCGSYEQFIGLTQLVKLRLTGNSERSKTPRGIDMHAVATLPMAWTLLRREFGYPALALAVVGLGVLVGLSAGRKTKDERRRIEDRGSPTSLRNGVWLTSSGLPTALGTGWLWMWSCRVTSTTSGPWLRPRAASAGSS